MKLKKTMNFLFKKKEKRKPRDGVVPKDIDGMTFQQAFEMVRIKNSEIVNKIKAFSGNTIYTPEVEDILTDEEIGWLRLAKMFRELK